MDLLDMLLTRTDPITTFLLLVFLVRQRKAGVLMKKHLVIEHGHTEETAAEFVTERSR